MKAAGGCQCTDLVHATGPMHAIGVKHDWYSVPFILNNVLSIIMLAEDALHE